MRYMIQTRRERAGAVDGVNLFFGALLGANLGTLDGLPPKDYFNIIIVLAGTIMTLRQFSASERRYFMIFTLLLYGALVYGFLNFESTRPQGLSEDAITRLEITLAVWVGTVLLVEYWPAKDELDRAKSPPEAAQDEP